MTVLRQYLKRLMGRADKPREVRHFAAIDNGCGMRVFVKAYAAHVKEEYRRGQEIYETSVASGTFRAPRPISLVESHNVIVWEYLDNLTPLREYLVRCLSAGPDGETTCTRMLHECGSLLAAIHRTWAPTGKGDYTRFAPEIHSPSEPLNRHVQSTLQESCCQWVHGDFGCANVFVQGTPGTPPAITVVDACLNRFAFDGDRPDIVAPAYVDVSHFISSLYNRRHFNSRVRKRISLWTEEFLVGYEETSGQRLDRATVFACAAGTLQRYQEYTDRRIERPTRDESGDRRFRLQSSKRIFAAALQYLPT